MGAYITCPNCNHTQEEEHIDFLDTRQTKCRKCGIKLFYRPSHVEYDCWDEEEEKA